LRKKHARTSKVLLQLRLDGSPFSSSAEFRLYSNKNTSIQSLHRAHKIIPLFFHGIEIGDEVMVDADKRTIYYYYKKTGESYEGNLRVITDPTDLKYIHDYPY
jgi:hypothetical protein